MLKKSFAKYHTTIGKDIEREFSSIQSEKQSLEMQCLSMRNRLDTLYNPNTCKYSMHELFARQNEIDYYDHDFKGIIFSAFLGAAVSSCISQLIQQSSWLLSIISFILVSMALLFGLLWFNRQFSTFFRPETYIFHGYEAKLIGSLIESKLQKEKSQHEVNGKSEVSHLIQNDDS